MRPNPPPGYGVFTYPPTESANARGGEVHRNGPARPARADAQDAGGTNFLLPRPPTFGQDYVPRVTADFVTVEFNNQRTGKTGCNYRRDQA